MPGAAEHRMVGYPILNAELAKPTVCQIDLHLRAQPPFRAYRKHVSHNQHPDHQHRIDRRPACVRVAGRKLLVHPIKIGNAVDLPDQMIRRHPLVEIERVEELTLSALSPSHHATAPANRSPDPRNHGSTAVSTRVLQHNRGLADIQPPIRKPIPAAEKSTNCRAQVTRSCRDAGTGVTNQGGRDRDGPKRLG